MGSNIDNQCPPASAKFDFETEAAAIDHFVTELVIVQKKRDGIAGDS